MDKNSNVQQGEANELKKMWEIYCWVWDVRREENIFCLSNESYLFSILMKGYGLGCDIVYAVLEGDKDTGIMK